MKANSAGSVSLDIHTVIVDYITGRINRRCHYEGLDAVKLRYGINQTVSSITKSALIFLIAFIIGVLPYTIIAVLSFNLLRHRAFGLHSIKKGRCTVYSTLFFVVIPYFIQGMIMDTWSIVLIYMSIAVAMLAFAPADTERRPLVGKGRRTKFRKEAVIITAILMLASVLIPNAAARVFLTYGALMETVTILPITYKVMGRTYNNYEKYENIYE